MRWFQVDADTPNDPRIQSVLARFGNAGFGMLVRLWCFVAAHGKRKPGWSLDTRGRPIPRAQIVAAIGASDDDFESLVTELTRNGHVVLSTWKKRGVIVLPAMSMRADTYARRRVRTLFEHCSHNVRVQDSTVQTKPSTYRKNSARGAHPKKQRPAGAPGPAPTTPNRKLIARLVYDVLDQQQRGTPSDFASLKEDCKRACAKAHVLYTPDLIGRTLESALAVRAKRRARA